MDSVAEKFSKRKLMILVTGVILLTAAVACTFLFVNYFPKSEKIPKK